MKNFEEIKKTLHDIKSPMTSVIGYSELLMRKNIGEKENDWVKKMHEDSIRVKELLQKLTDQLSDAVTESPDRVN